jgi:hypothetical protein
LGAVSRKFCPFSDETHLGPDHELTAQKFSVEAKTWGATIDTTLMKFDSGRWTILVII